MAKPGNGNSVARSGYISGGYGMVNATRLNWSIPGYDITNFTYRAEVWNADFTTLLFSVNVPSQSGAVAFNPNILPNRPVWLMLVGRNNFLDTWCDDPANWYYVAEINERHCTPDAVVDLYYFNKNNFDPAPDDTFRKYRSYYPYAIERPSGNGFVYQGGKI